LPLFKKEGKKKEEIATPPERRLAMTKEIKNEHDDLI